MITYNPKDWFTFIFRIHRSETFRQLIPLMIGISVYSLVVLYFELRYLRHSSAVEITQNISVIYSILGFTLSLLLVFRTNSAYDRWWEGRKQWGALTNVSRALAAHFHSLIPTEGVKIRGTLAGYIGLFSYTLHRHLRSERANLADIEGEYNTGAIGEGNMNKIIAAYHQPQEVYKQLTAFVQEQKRLGAYNVQDMFLFKSELNELINVCGACERIKSTPIPFSYSVFLKKFIFFYVMLFPIVYCESLSYFIVPATVLILYVLASLELIAEEIEDPFNGEANDLPTEEMAANMNKSVKAVLLEK